MLTRVHATGVRRLVTKYELMSLWLRFIPWLIQARATVFSSSCQDAWALDTLIRRHAAVVTSQASMVGLRQWLV